MGPKTTELVEVIDKIIALLLQDGDKHWSEWMVESKRRLLNSDFSGIEYLLRAYGGMGSFNDFVIGQTEKNGKVEWKPGAAENNKKLNELSSAAYELASDIKRNHEIEKA